MIPEVPQPPIHCANPIYPPTPFPTPHKSYPSNSHEKHTPYPNTPLQPSRSSPQKPKSHHPFTRKPSSLQSPTRRSKSLTFFPTSYIPPSRITTLRERAYNPYEHQNIERRSSYFSYDVSVFFPCVGFGIRGLVRVIREMGGFFGGGGDV